MSIRHVGLSELLVAFTDLFVLLFLFLSRSGRWSAVGVGTVFSFMVWSCFAVLYKVDHTAKVDTCKSGCSSLIPKTDRKIFAFGTLAMILLVINMAVQVCLVPLFIDFGDGSETWLTCVEADWQSSRGVGNGYERRCVPCISPARAYHGFASFQHAGRSARHWHDLWRQISAPVSCPCHSKGHRKFDERIKVL